MTVIILLLVGVVVIAVTAGLQKKVDAEIQIEQEQKEAAKKAQELAQARELERQRQMQNLRQSFIQLKSDVQSAEERVAQSIYRYFTDKPHSVTYEDIKSLVSTTKEHLSKMKEINQQLKMHTNDVFVRSISDAEDAVRRAELLFEAFKSYVNKVSRLPNSVMMEIGNYGKQNKAFSESILTMTREDSIRFIQHCETVLSEGQLDKIFEIDIENVLRHVWFFATEKNFSVSDYNRAKDIFLRIGKKVHVDICLADFYSKKKMGSEKVLHDDVRKHLDKNPPPAFLVNIASGLMWMNAYQQEHAVLEHMLAKGMEMTPKAQERLYSLSTSGGKAPESFSVESSDDSLYFDVSSLTWRDAEYTGFYDTLAFQDKLLTYSLAIRDEDKELLVAQGITAPNIDTLLEKLNETLVEEFGPTVTAKSVHCIALSGSSEEPMDGILVATTECKHMGVFLHIARIGKKLIIKFYTLFIPIGTDLTVQRQQSMSMSKKLSPTVTMWESSLKDTMLVAVQQLLNSDMPVIPTGKSEEPVGPASGPVYF